MAQPSSISKEVFNFLNTLRENNNREWFQENKELYVNTHEKVIHFADNLLDGLKQYDDIDTLSGKKSLYRIYRDTRFSKDKTPYKLHFGGGFKRATEALRGGYYFHIEEGNSFVAGGFFSPSAQDLKHIRSQIAIDGSSFLEIIQAQNFQKHFGNISGSQLKTAPKGFEKDHQYIDLLRFKQLIVTEHFSDEEVLSDQFASKMLDSFQAMRPFFNYMSDILTTDLNGESIL